MPSFGSSMPPIDYELMIVERSFMVYSKKRLSLHSDDKILELIRLTETFWGKLASIRQQDRREGMHG